jgi:subtilisin-like proprotein convertase family protein
MIISFRQFFKEADMKSKNRSGVILFLSAVAVIAAILLNSCGFIINTESDTEYGKNRTKERGVPCDSDRLINEIGQDKYDQLISGIGRDNLDRLTYETGQSNITTFINIINDMQKIIDLLNGDNKLTAYQVVSLLDLTDRAIVMESPSSEDTIGKIANLINYTWDMNYLKDIIWGVQDFNGQTGIERLCLAVALVDENLNTMPVIINEVASSQQGMAVLLRIFNETVDIRDLTTVINNTTVLTNLTGIMNNITNIEGSLDGTDSLVSTLNNTNEPERLAYALNNLSINGVVSNDDGFESGALGSLNWAVSGTKEWKATQSMSAQGSYSAAIGVSGLNDMIDNDRASLELTSDISDSGSVTFSRMVSTESNKDFLKFYIDDVLKAKWSGGGGAPVWVNESFPVSAGVRRFRWEFVKDGSSSAGLDSCTIDSVTLPGNRGAALFPYQKVAVILNRMTLSSQNTVAEVFNSIDQNGLDNLVSMLNITAYPSDWESGTVKFIEITNNLNSVDNLAGFINGLAPGSAKHIVDAIDYVSDTSKMYTLINGLEGQPGEKMYMVVNGLTPAGTSAMIKILDNVPINDLLTIINGVTDTSDMPLIFNNLNLSGTDVSDVDTDASPTAAERMAVIINDVSDGIAPGSNLTVATHLVRLINDLSGAGGSGAANVGRIVSGLDNTVTPSGASRIVRIMDNLAVSDTANRYNDPLCDGATGPATYPVTSYTNSINYYIPDNNSAGATSPINVAGGPSSIYKVTVKVNITHTYTGDITLSLKSPAGTWVTLSNKRGGSGDNYYSTVFDSNAVISISSGSAPFTGTYRPESLLTAFNGQNSNGTWELKVVDSASSDTGSINNWTLNLTEMVTPPPSIDCTSDKFGRLTTFMNDMGSEGARTTAYMINGISATKISNLTDLIGSVRRIRYISDVINNLTNVDLMLAVLNDSNMQPVKMRRLLDSFGDQTYPARTAFSPRYTDAMSSVQGDGLGRLTVLINEVVTGYGAANIIALMNNVSDFNKLTGLISGINENGTPITHGGAHRIRYMSNLMNNVQNINLLVNIMNGFTSPATPPVNYEPLVKLINEVGASTRKGSGTKPVGDMSIVWGTINKLAWDYALNAPRSNAEQSKLIYVMNGVNKCGVQSGYDLNSPASHLLPEPCSSGNKRLSDFMLGMNDAKPVSIIVGEVTDVNKTINVMNGVRDAEKLIDVINYMPGEVTSAFINKNNINVIYTSTLYLLNRLTAKELVGIIHWGTGIPDGISRTGTVYWFTGFGPYRMGQMMNTETGPRLKEVLDKFGVQTATAAMVCGFGTTNLAPQTMSNKNGLANETFQRSESIYITADPTPGNRGSYTHVYQALSTNCQRYLPEKITGGLICHNSNPELDTTVWNASTSYKYGAICAIPLSITVSGGMSGCWDIIMGEGFMATLLSLAGGNINYPPAPKWWAAGYVDPAVNAPVQH